jgi:hypothetical protein
VQVFVGSDSSDSCSFLVISREKFPQSCLRDRTYKPGQFAVNNLTLHVPVSRENLSFTDQRQLFSFQINISELLHSQGRDI